jgi:hypothetical protein
MQKRWLWKRSYQHYIGALGLFQLFFCFGLTLQALLNNSMYLSRATSGQESYYYYYYSVIFERPLDMTLDIAPQNGFNPKFHKHR